MGIDLGPAPGVPLGVYKVVQQETLRKMAGGARDTHDGEVLRHALKFLTVNEAREAFDLPFLRDGNRMGIAAPNPWEARADRGSAVQEDEGEGEDEGLLWFNLRIALLCGTAIAVILFSHYFGY